jgi:hypothetical protein
MNFADSHSGFSINQKNVRKRKSAIGGKTWQGAARQTLDRTRQLSGVTTLASWAKAIGKALEAEGIDSGKLFQWHDCSPTEFRERAARGSRPPRA